MKINFQKISALNDKCFIAYSHYQPTLSYPAGTFIMKGYEKICLTIIFS